MSWLYRRLVRPVLFSQESEHIHDRTLRALALASRSRALCAISQAFFGAPELPVRLFGLDFPNPVGLAAGMDKDAEAVPIWAALGFGFCELGGVTRDPQPGNPQPRMFRVIPDHALINRMGFNNVGAEAFAAALRHWRQRARWPAHPVGINLGKSKATPLEEAAEEYASSFNLLRDLVDFFVVNVSSPNTPDLRKLQDRPALNQILAALNHARDLRPNSHGQVMPPASPTAGPHRRQTQLSPVKAEAPARDLSGGHLRPILVKVAPDLSLEALDEIIELAEAQGVAGIVATNTTIARPSTSDPKRQRLYAETGGLSGRPLAARTTAIIRHLYRQTHGRLPIIGVGGIFTAADAWEKITAGASLVQVYTGMVYEGPGVARRIVRGLRQRLAQAGLADLRSAVGIGTPH